MKKVLLALLLVLVPSAYAQWTNVTATKITDGSSPTHLLSTGSICFTGSDQNGNAINFKLSGGGQNINKPFCQSIQDGALAAALTVPDSAITAPQNICYRIEVIGRTLLRKDIVCGGIVTGPTWSYDDLVPGTPAPPAPSSPSLDVGNLTILTSCAGPGCATNTMHVYMDDPLVIDSGKIQPKWRVKIRPVRLSCNTTFGSIDVYLETRSEADPNSSGTPLSAPLTCTANGTAQLTTFASSTVSANVPVALVFQNDLSASGIRFYFEYEPTR